MTIVFLGVGAGIGICLTLIAGKVRDALEEKRVYNLILLGEALRLVKEGECTTTVPIDILRRQYERLERLCSVAWRRRRNYLWRLEESSRSKARDDLLIRRGVVLARFGIRFQSSGPEGPECL